MNIQFSFRYLAFFVFLFWGHPIAFAQNIPNIQNFSDNSKCLKVESFFEFPKSLQETSALIFTNGYFWTINDGGNKSVLYALHNPFADSILMNKKKDIIAKSVELPFSNIDWEALAVDSTYFYIGDFGNNLGNRKNLCIYKIKISEVLLEKIQTVDTLLFEYEDQTNFKPRRLHAFDCESMLVDGNTIFLFSKNWSNLKTNIYRLNNGMKSQKAIKHETWNPGFYVTDACTVGGMVYLSGYNFLGSQYIYSTNWKKGSSFKLELKPAQIEGICMFRETKTGELSCYLTTEKRKSQPAGMFKILLKP